MAALVTAASLTCSPIPTVPGEARADGDGTLQVAQGSPFLMTPDYLEMLRGRQNLQASRSALENDPGSPTTGSSDGAVTLVEFFDYRCPYCKDLARELRSRLAAHPELRVVFKEWPIFGGVSVTAARAALAADRQGRYLDLHEILMATRGSLTETGILAAAADLGLDLPRLRADMVSPDVEAQLARTAELARDLGFRGTPVFVIGDQIIPGLIEDEVLRTAIEAGRKRE